MKIFISILFLLCNASCVLLSSYDISNNTQKHKIICNVEKKSKNEIFDKCMEWLAESYVSSKKVIQLKDKKNGVIIGRAIMRLTSPIGTTYPMFFRFKIEVKDNKFRITFNNFYQRDGGFKAYPTTKEQFKEIKVNCYDIKNRIKKHILKNDKW